MTHVTLVVVRTATPADALCIGVLATQVFLDTYATEGIRPDLAREVLAGYGTAAFESRLLDPQTSFVVAERNAHLIGFAETSRRRWPSTARGYASIGTVDHLIEGQAHENQVLVRVP